MPLLKDAQQASRIGPVGCGVATQLPQVARRVRLYGSSVYLQGPLKPVRVMA